MNHLQNLANEPVLDYAPSSEERKKLKEALTEANSQRLDVPMYIGGQKVYTNNKIAITPPHDHQKVVAYFNKGEKTHVEQAIAAALSAKEYWEHTPAEKRAAIFLKAADLIAGKYRAKINAATMIGQSKNAYQAEIDSACELIDFLRFNVKYMYDIYSVQPYSPQGIKNTLEYRPLEGFVYALTPFNFTAIGGNLPTAPALLGNTVVWKPAETQIYSAQVFMETLVEAGLPEGVINMVYVDGIEAGEVIFDHRDFAGLHFTGSTKVFREIWHTIGKNLNKYKTFPRIVGETGGKNFVLAHPSADVKALATALVRGSFEYQGQKCSAASRAYIPSTLWQELKVLLLNDLKNIKVGAVEDFSNFMNAVIDERAFNKIAAYIDDARYNDKVEIIFGGQSDKSKGYFIEPTVLLTYDPYYTTMSEEIFGPVLTIFVYEPEDYEKTLKLIDATSPYGLTGAFFASDKAAIDHAMKALYNSAGNFYLNDKPTGAVVNQQPFGGSRASGTNDKAGSLINLLRWVSPRAVKENLNPPTDFAYPFMREE